MREHRRIGMDRLEIENSFGLKLLVDNTCAIPYQNVSPCFSPHVIT